MPRYGIGFSDNGRFTTLPNVFVLINADNLDLRPVSPGGVVAILAEGAGFFPPGVASTMPMGSGSPRRYITPSTLLTATEYAVRPFAQFDRGAGQVIVVPVNKATPAVLALNKSGPPTLAATLTTKGYGTRMNTVTIKVETLKVTVSLPSDTGPPLMEVFAYTTVEDLCAQINGRSGILTAVFAAEGTLTAVPTTPMTGGTEPVAIPADWDEALHALDGIRLTSIATCTPDPAVHAMLSAYCILHRCRGYIGADLAVSWNGTLARQTAMTALKNAAGVLNAPRLMHIGLGADGLPGYASTAPRIAALAASLPPSVPMTFKHLDFASLEARLDPIAEVGGIDGLLLYGVAPPIPDPDAPQTSLLSRGLSTWTGDDNLYRREHSVLGAVDGIQDQIESGCRTFLGNEGTEATVRRAINLVDQILFNATRPTASVRINSYRKESISAFLDGQVLNISAAFTPIPPINFIPVSLILERTEITQTFQVPL